MPRSLPLLCLLVLGAAHAQDRIEPVEQQQRIARERAAVQADYRAEEARCQAQFAVTSCVEKARAQRRAALERLDHQRAVLDGMERKRRAADRMERIREKVRAAEARPPAPPVDVTARTPRAAASAASGASAPPLLALPPAAGPSAPRRAAKASDYQKRLRDAEAHRDAVERRNAERAKTHPPAAPLPAPAASR